VSKIRRRTLNRLMVWTHSMYSRGKLRKERDVQALWPTCT